MYEYNVRTPSSIKQIDFTKTLIDGSQEFPANI
jgi:hypothetical protein